MMPMTQISDKSIFFRKLAVRTSEYMMSLNPVGAAAYLTLPYFHASFSLASSAGVIVSMPCSLQSCTTRSIKRDICAVS